MSSISEQLSSYGKSTGPRAKGFRLGATIDTSRLSALGCGGKCCKLALMGLNIFIVLTGFAVLVGGAYAMNNVDLIQAIGNDFTNMIIACGVLLVFIGSLGLCGAMRESRALLACFLLMLGLMTIVLLIFGAYALSLSDKNKEGTLLADLWRKMSNNERVSIQDGYGCCGAYSRTQLMGDPCDPATHPINGCFGPMITDYQNLSTAFGAIFVIMSGIMIATLVTAYCLMASVAKVEEEKAGAKRKPRR